MAAPYAVGPKVPPIDREDSCRGEGFGGHDERGIGEVHRMAGVLVHQLECSSQSRAIEEPDRGAPARDEVPEAIRPTAGWREHVERLGQDRNRRDERFAQGSQDFPTPRVGRVLGIEERDDWAGVEQNHRRSFRRMALRTPGRVWVTGATA